MHSEILNSYHAAVKQFGSNNIFGGKIYYHDNPEKIWYAGGIVNLSIARIAHKGLRKMDSSEYSNPTQTDYVTGCCMFTSWEVINKLKGFDEDFNMYVEDVDLCLRAKQDGINCYYWPNARVWHKVSASIGGNYSTK